ncbi:MAG: hypothetical protein A2020_11850 [Lentisphaerae bacterium GWF2_45_14]|nr:MAG: hypothetical protein A2020_11850 [Lentisphaerae bacterium GWF2_45_14]
MPLRTKVKIGTGSSKATQEAMEETWRNFCYGQGVLEIIEDGGLPVHSFSIIGGNIPDLKQDYSLNVDSNGVAGIAVNEKNLLYAWFTFLQLLHPNNNTLELENVRLPHVEIADSPSLKFRGIHFCVFPETSLPMLEKLLKLSAFLKFSHIVVEFWGMLKLDSRPELAWPQAFDKKSVAHLLRTIHNMGAEIIPMFNHLGHAAGARSLCGRHTILNQNPKLAPLFEFDGWTWCLSNPHTHKLLKNIRTELIEFFGSINKMDYFFLGCDEAYSFASCDDCSGHEPGQLLAGYLNTINDELKEQGIRPIIWGDQLLDPQKFPKPFSAFGTKTKGAIKILSRDFIIADWQYNICDSQEDSFKFFMDNGFEVVPAPWDNYHNIKSLCASAKKLELKGVLATTWNSLVQHPYMLWNSANVMWESEPSKDFTSHLNSIAMKLCGLKLDYTEAGWGTKEVHL